MLCAAACSDASPRAGPGRGAMLVAGHRAAAGAPSTAPNEGAPILLQVNAPSPDRAAQSMKAGLS